MREQDLQTLEFDKVLSVLATCALSSVGREACLALRPETTPDTVAAHTERAWQFFCLLGRTATFPLRSFPDIRPALRQAVHEGAMLEGQKLLEILDVVELSRTLGIVLLRATEGYDQLADLPSRLLSFPLLEATLRRCLTENGQLADEASPELTALRRRLRSLREEIEQRLQHLLRAPEMREVIADRYITMRNNRFVIPVRTSRRSRAPGIVQDRSGSGETVFLEPLFAVELNNRLLLTKKEEEAEERRVLLWLTGLVRDEEPRLESVFVALTEIDVLYAKALLARKHQCSKPRFGGAALRLPAARHPLLLASNKPVVPVDLLIPEGKNGLIITGPNTGGKTVALKTLGLLCLMAQSGLLIPAAEDNRLPIFHGVFADIGDPQSLEQSLSTFSAHIQNLVEIMQTLSAPALVLFDEPGGGTDPIEGGALACGILTHLKTCGVLVAAATHLAPVKLFALADGSYQVAAVEFDLDTLTPRYRLHYDVIGQSLGLSMARRLGVPETACAAAEAALPQDARLLAQAITKLEETRAALEHERTLAAAEREQVEALRARQQALVTELERKQQALQEKLTEAEAFVRRLRQHERRQSIADRRHQLGVTSTEGHDAKDALPRSADQRENVSSARPQPSPPVFPEHPSPLQVGEQVQTQDGQICGELVAVHGGRARIRHGGVTFDVAITQVRKAP